MERELSGFAMVVIIVLALAVMLSVGFSLLSLIGTVESDLVSQASPTAIEKVLPTPEDSHTPVYRSTTEPLNIPWNQILLTLVALALITAGYFGFYRPRLKSKELALELELVLTRTKVRATPPTTSKGVASLAVKNNK
jgi:hypothetical protein